MTVTSWQKQRYAQLLSQSKAIIHRSAQPTIKDELLLLSQYAQADDIRDSYGQGGSVHAFEQELAWLFDKPAALFLPTGTLAQNAALKCYSERAQKQGVALHPTSHLLLHEHQAVETLWQLRVKTVGQADAVITAKDIDTLDASEICAIVIETPMRELGGIMPDWQSLVAIRQWCNNNQVAMHMDGARVWQTTLYYQRSLKEIAALFDSVYASFYKDLNGIFGAALLGEQALVEEARIWARRAGGNPVTLYPEALAARRGIALMSKKMPQFISYAITLGQKLAAESFEIIPESPQAAMFHIKINSDSQSLVNKLLDYAQRTGVMALPLPRAETEKHCICEISIGDQAVQYSPEFWAEHLKACLGE